MQIIKLVESSGFYAFDSSLDDWITVISFKTNQTLEDFDITLKKKSKIQNIYKEMELKNELQQLRAQSMVLLLAMPEENRREFIDLYFESKDREKTFQEKWVDKLLKDMQDRNIGYGILVSTSSPKDFKKDDAYVTRHDCILVMQMNDKLIHSVVSFIKNELAIKSKNNKDFDGTAEMKR